MEPPFKEGDRVTKISLDKRNALRVFKNELANRLVNMKLTDAFTEEELPIIYNNFRAKYPDYEDFKNANYLELCSVSLMRYTLRYDLQTNMNNLLNLMKKLDNLTYDDLEQKLQPVLKFNTQETLF